MNPFKIFSPKICFVLFFMILSAGLIGQDTVKESPISASEEIAPKVDEKKNNVKIPNLLFSGVLLEHQEKKQTWYIPPLFELVPPNTVEGFVLNPNVSFTQHLQDGKFLNLKPGLRYGFGNKRLQAQLAAQFYYAPSHKAFIQLSGGRFVEQFNPTSTLDAFNNTYNTFLQKDNFLKIYERTYLEVKHTIAPVKDFLLSTTFSWNNRSPLQNLPKYDKEDSEFTSNIPLNNELLNTVFEEHQALLWHAQLQWQFGHQFIRHRGELRSFSNYPAISLSYSGALSGVLGSDLSYQKIALQITESFKSHQIGSGKFLLELGDFIAKEELHFMDFKHFNGQQTVYSDFQIGDFQLLDYHLYSTTNFYLRGHYEHELNPLTIKGRQKKIQPIISVNYLYTPADGSYWELGAGAKLSEFWRIGFYNSWRDGQHERFGVRVGVVME